MFSEYASRFLAQSQSRLLNSQVDPSTSRNPLERQRAIPSRAPSRGYLQRQPQSNPYQSSQGSRFPFASRLSAAPAPLFYSANDEFREEDDGEEHEREVADYYALQRSRRDFGAARLDDPEDADGRIGRGSRMQVSRPGRFAPSASLNPSRKAGGIRSSWTADDENAVDMRNDSDPTTHNEHLMSESRTSTTTGRNRDRLVDVELASTIHEDDELLERHDVAGEDTEDDDSPSIHTFPRREGRQPLLQGSSSRYVSQDAGIGSGLYPRSSSPGRQSVLPTAPPAPADPPRHDQFFATFYLVCMASVFATFILICLHTTAPSKNSKLGDTVYTALRACFYLFAWDTVISVVVALVWLAALRSFARPLVTLLIITVPIILLSFTLYPFVTSFKPTFPGGSIQDKVMRWGSIVPALATVSWVFTVYKGRKSLGRAVEILEFSTRILAACPALVPIGFATLATVVAWTWVWMLMFTRVFLGGHTSTSKHLFILNASTWWQAIFFILMYLWTLGVIAGVQRATTAATVSQWYFHRLAIPAPSSQRVVRASLTHSLTTIFGTICFSTLIALAVRLPLLLLPQRISSWLAFAFYSIVPTSIATLTNPLTLSYAAIHSRPLTLSARGLSELTVIAPASHTTTLTPRAFKGTNAGPAPSLFGYRLAKLLLHATRLITSLAFGFGGWVSTARSVNLAGSYRGSLYAYVVGLIAGAIGWAVLGAMEGVLGGILDAVVVCWGSEVGSQGAGAARYCREAGELLSGEEGL